MYDAPQRLPLPKVINLLTDLKEKRDVLVHSSWVNYPMMKIVREFEASMELFPPIKVGTPDPYLPPAPTGRRDAAPRALHREEMGWLPKQWAADEARLEWSLTAELCVRRTLKRSRTAMVRVGGWSLIVGAPLRRSVFIPSVRVQLPGRT
jgi:hypothetical protein